jgi:hypothetical protein
MQKKRKTGATGRSALRAYGDTLTGGTGDVSPQLLSATVTLSAANTYTSISIPLPVPRVGLRKGRAVIVEVLKVYFDSSTLDGNFAAGGASVNVSAQVSTVELTNIFFANPAVFAFYNKEYRGAFTATGTFGVINTEPYAFDLTDGAGHGFLVATDNIFLAALTNTFAGAATFNFKVLYRMKEVNLEEYIGIVQSQQ